MNDIFWMLPGKLAGMSHPGDSEAVLSAMKNAGIGAIVTLTLKPLRREMLNRYAFDYLHLPIKDFSAPKMSQIEMFVRFCDDHIGTGKAVAVHCMAGIGRTGVMLACYLVHLGIKPDKAIRRVRRLRPGALETTEQENSVYEFAAVKSYED